jgi:centrosomal protein CEP192
VSLGRRNILKITVKNTGHRAAFVKAVCYAGKTEPVFLRDVGVLVEQ